MSAHSGCRIKALGPGDCGRWDAFVEAAPDATFFHRSIWREIIEDVLGHRCHYLYAEENGELVGILPLAEIHSRLFGHALISTPFCVYGGAVASNQAVADHLNESAAARARDLDVDYLELRNRRADVASWPCKDLYVAFRKELSGEHEANFRAIPRKQRAMVRKGINVGLEASTDSDLDAFYGVYSESLRNLGTPVLPKTYYARVKQSFGDDCEITVIRHHGRPVAAVMSFYFRDEVHPYYGGSIRQGRELAANDFMYWAVMQRAVERGARLFDFGRSKRDTGSYHFKRHWGFEPAPLPYQYHLVRSKSVPDVSPANPKYRLFIRAWKHLPLVLSRAFGPPIARNLG